MKIKYFGDLNFEFLGKKVTVAHDPVNNGLDSDIVLLSSDKIDTANIKGKVFNWPGEYEVNGVVIIAIESPTTRDNIYKIFVDNFSVVILNGVRQKLTDEMLEKIGNTDVLLLPLRFDPQGLTAEIAHDIYEDIDPRIVIPYDLDEKSLAEFAKEFGSMPAAVDSFEVSETSLPQDSSIFVVVKS